MNAALIPAQAEMKFEGVIFDVYQWQQEMFDGSFATFERLRRSDAVRIYAIKDNKLVIVHEEQPGRPKLYDAPAGAHDQPGETHLGAAQREMLEETGMEFADWKLVYVEQPDVKMEWFVYTFIATGFVGQREQHLDAGERIEIHEMTYAEYRALRGGGELRWWPPMLNDIESINELLALPEFKGKEIER